LASGQRPGGAAVLAAAGSAAKPATPRLSPAEAKRAGALLPTPQGITMKTEPIATAVEPAPAPKPPEPVEKVVPAGPEDPVKACAKEAGNDPVKNIGNFFVKTWCVDRMCEKPAFYDHFECKKLRDLRVQH
jgi:hypothetical protein